MTFFGRLGDRISKAFSPKEHRKSCPVVFGERDRTRGELYQQLPLGVSVADYSAVKRRLDQLFSAGVDDLRLHLSKHTDLLFDLVKSIQHVDANDRLLNLFRVDSLQEYLDLAHDTGHWKKTGWAEFYAQQFANLVHGKSPAIHYLDLAADGTAIEHRTIAWIPETREDDWSSVVTTHEDVTNQDFTERANAEEALRKSHALYRQAEELGKLGHWEWDNINHTMISCSDQFAQIYGMTVDEAMVFFTDPENDMELVHPDDRERYLQENEASLVQKKALDIEYRITTSAGDQRFVHQVSEIVLDAEGRVAKSFGTVQDITDRVQAEERLRQSHAHYSQAEKVGKLGHWEWDSVNNKMISCSEQFANIFGMTIDETTAYFTSLEKDAKVIHPDDLERYLQNEYVLIDGTSRTDIEYRLITPSGELRHVHEQAEVVLDNRGKQIKSFGTIQDITDRVLAEEKLRQSHAHYSQAEKVGKLGHWEWDYSSYKLVSCSEQLAKIYEMTVKEVIARFTCRQQEINIVHPDDRERYEQHMIDSEKQRTGANIEYRIITANGSVRHVHLQSQMVTDDQNKIIRSFGIVQDISERVTLESERNRLANQLVQGQKMESLGVLAGGIAHDFNNILTAILGYAALAQEEARGMEDLLGYIQHIVKGGKRASDLTQQILAFSRQYDVVSHPMEVVSVIREVSSLLQPTLPANTVLENDLDDDCGTIEANPTAVHQLLMNICTNAVQAMEPEGGRIAIFANIASQAELPAELDGSDVSSWVRIGVTDTGTGIPEGIRDRIFEPYFTTKEVGRGTGMGLAAVHGIVSNLGGVIKVSSNAGRGTLFEVFLPTTNNPVVTPAPRQKAVPNNANILFIDDEEDLVNLAKISLERLGHTVNGYSDPAEAIASAAADLGKYDILITDFSMPQMNGLNAANMITELNPGLPVVLITGKDTGFSDAQLTEAGVRVLLHKPCSVEDLSQAISEAQR